MIFFVLRLFFILGTLTPVCDFMGRKKTPNENESESESSKDEKTQKYLESVTSKISYLLVSKYWKLDNHPNEGVYEQYPGEWEDAFAIMVKERYPAYKRTIENAEDLFNLANDGKREYDRNLQSIIVFHPMNGTPYSIFIKSTMTALRLRNLHQKYNFFSVDMSPVELNVRYKIFQEVTGLNSKYEELAESMSMFIIKGVNNGSWKPSDIHLIGFCVSANLVGYIGRHINLVFNEKIASIVALDPYNNGKNQHFIHTSRDDADVVHIYHSSSLGLGTRERVATADFVFNGGLIQPECRRSLFLPELPGCSHKKSVVRFWYVILFPKKFQARKCSTWQRFKNCFCEDNEKATIAYPIEQNTARGIYQVRTLSSKPYGLGQEGSSCKPEKKAKFEEKRRLVRLRAGIK